MAAQSTPLRLLGLLALSLSGALILLGRPGPPPQSFLAHELGPRASTTLVAQPRPAANAPSAAAAHAPSVAVQSSGYEVSRAGARLQLASTTIGASDWIRHQGGARRLTPYGE